MNESQKKAGLIVVIVLALGAAGFGAMKAFSTEEMVVEKRINLPPGHKSEKEQALEQQSKGQGSSAPTEERDLG